MPPGKIRDLHGRFGCASIRSVLFGTLLVAVAATAGANNVFMFPTSNILWRTAPSSEFDIPVLMPHGASSATLVVTGHNYRREYTGICDEQFRLSLPAADSAAKENVYDLTLTFDDPLGTTRHAKLAVVQGAAFGGSAEAAVGSAASPYWNRVRSQVVLPVYSGVDTMSINGETVSLDPAELSGWWMFMPLSGTTYDIQLSGDSSLMWEAMLFSPPTGFKFIFR